MATTKTFLYTTAIMVPIADYGDSCIQNVYHDHSLSHGERYINIPVPYPKLRLF